MKKIIFLIIIAIAISIVFIGYAKNPKHVDDSGYAIITGENAGKLQVNINKAIAAGYKLQGGVAISEGIFYQAVYK